MSLIIPSNTISGGFEVANSCRFDGSSAYLHKTNSGAGNRKTFTISMWFKRSDLTGDNGYSALFTASNGDDGAFLKDDGTLEIYSASGQLFTNRKFRDVGAWYHICVAVDTTLSTSGNRIRLYVNGTEETSFGTDTAPGQNNDGHFCNSSKHAVGCRATSETMYFGGYIAEVVLIDGQQLTPSSFGEFDEDSPTIFKPIDVSGLSFGTNGFYLDFEDSSNLGNDKNGGTDLTEVNLSATDSATDVPTNNFATWNPLQATGIGAAFSEGNLFAEQGSATTYNARINSTIGVSSGKWYAEFKWVQISSSNTSSTVGVSYADIPSDINPTSTSNGDVSLRIDRSLFNSGSETGSYSASISNTDIIGVALDMDNKKVYFSVNGTWANSSNPSTSTNPISISASSSGETFMVFNCRPLDEYIQANFGNPPFSISSSNSDANGYGSFEFSVPSGYYSLCTKNLAEFG